MNSTKLGDKKLYKMDYIRECFNSIPVQCAQYTVNILNRRNIVIKKTN
jgi:hypothetical protein